MINFINIHTHKISDESEGTFSILNIFASGLKMNPPNRPCSIGLHPWYISAEKYEEELTFIQRYADNPCVLAIGECGLDSKVKNDMNLQRIIFKAQINISEAVRKPLVIHNVGKWDELLQIKRELDPKQAWILHGFRGKPEMAKQLLKHGFFLSLGKKILADEHKINDVLQEIPLNRLFLETDDATDDINEVYKLTSSILELPVENLSKKIVENFQFVFQRKSLLPD